VLETPDCLKEISAERASELVQFCHGRTLTDLTEELIVQKFQMTNSEAQSLINYAVSAPIIKVPKNCFMERLQKTKEPASNNGYLTPNFHKQDGRLVNNIKRSPNLRLSEFSYLMKESLSVKS
jgi:hypothetical protein